ncbi:winged helix-turn-helix transcriptional regulator [Halocatena pleomorpha]|uniref:Winged helix-turn-helix transcriptional regulator n=1 Tax=Halocatena pleomorpha TaxID=1785090 RepID=A0A3P3RH29_9EURY|nr:winged helix-turn-helix transcriptional regulator [Halocatena pleomorpha]RRJ32837.1 winged helix-turn-helix transcriptional regulator [Halocatena pleomorpha]
MSATEDRDEEIGGGTLQDCPPSAKLVAKVLEYDGPLTQQELAEETLLPTRTVRYAVSQLDEIGLVHSRFSFTDARKRVYSLRTE